MHILAFMKFQLLPRFFSCNKTQKTLTIVVFNPITELQTMSTALELLPQIQSVSIDSDFWTRLSSTKDRLFNSVDDHCRVLPTRAQPTMESQTAALPTMVTSTLVVRTMAMETQAMPTAGMATLVSLPLKDWISNIWQVLPSITAICYTRIQVFGDLVWNQACSTICVVTHDNITVCPPKWERFTKCASEYAAATYPVRNISQRCLPLKITRSISSCRAQSQMQYTYPSWKEFSSFSKHLFRSKCPKPQTSLQHLVHPCVMEQCGNVVWISNILQVAITLAVSAQQAAWQAATSAPTAQSPSILLLSRLQPLPHQ